ncbi:MAG: hypothetical protein COB46_04565 [Rhodospirillaceae bacterium]|nr:MAG: hypothetical protein COB46_04565 [Rhodospirillaceae bacterium]
MGLFGSDSGNKTKKGPVFSKPVDPDWVLTPNGGFFSFLDLDPEAYNLNGAGGIYLIWHGGVRPEWVFAGASTDLATDLHDAGENAEISYYEQSGGLFVAWALIKPEFRQGAVKYMEEFFTTLVENPGSYGNNTQAVPITAPTAKKIKPKRQPKP